jgi:hypothetical protein
MLFIQSRIRSHFDGATHRYNPPNHCNNLIKNESFETVNAKYNGEWRPLIKKSFIIGPLVLNGRIELDLTAVWPVQHEDVSIDLSSASEDFVYQVVELVEDTDYKLEFYLSKIRFCGNGQG